MVKTGYLENIVTRTFQKKERLESRMLSEDRTDVKRSGMLLPYFRA